MKRLERCIKLEINPTKLAGYQPTENYANTILNKMCTTCINRKCNGTGCKIWTDCVSKIEGEIK